MSKHGVIILPHVVERNVTITTGERPQRHVEVRIVCRIIGPRGDEIRFPTWGEGMDRRDRATQKAITDADKYATLRALRIRVHDADDENGSGDDGDTHWQPPARQHRQAPPPANGNGGNAEYPGDDPDRKDRPGEEHRDLIQDVIRKASDLKRLGVIDAKAMQEAVASARASVDAAHEAVGRLDAHERKGGAGNVAEEPAGAQGQAAPPADAKADKPKTRRVPKYPGDDATDDRWRRWEMSQLADVEVDETFRRDLAKMLTGGERDRTGDLSRAERKRRVEIAIRLHAGTLAPKYDSTGALSITDQDNNEVDPWSLPGPEVVG
jgi:hypothetical protein